MKKVTLREFEAVTGKHQKFLKELLQAVPFTRGANRAYLYDSTQALPAIYAGAKVAGSSSRHYLPPDCDATRSRAKISCRQKNFLRYTR